MMTSLFPATFMLYLLFVLMRDPASPMGWAAIIKSIAALYHDSTLVRVPDE